MQKLLIVAAILLAVFLWTRPPSSRRIASGLEIDRKVGTIVYKDTTYAAEWSTDETVFAGDLRYVGRAYARSLPLVTHDAVITTGEFSDPAVVAVSDIRKGSMTWRSRKKPEGTLVVVHFVPATVGIHDSLKRLRRWDEVEIKGYLETDSQVQNSDGGFYRLTHDNHKLLLVTSVIKS